ncbi:MAG: hypothetical protein HY830_16135 [Actinobacteria bacterium]|nr:hypothetical protein [Actinomycetota bacterium]
MDVELLVVRDCPNVVAAREVLARAADLAGVTDLHVAVTVIGTDEEAQQRGFAGSPTFLVEGVDPFATPAAGVGLACRVYPTPRGLSGTPDVAAVRDALLGACTGQASAAGDR